MSSACSGYLARVDVVDEFLNIVMASLAASSNKDGLPLLALGGVDNDLSQMLLPRYLCQIRNYGSTVRQT